MLYGTLTARPAYFQNENFEEEYLCVVPKNHLRIRAPSAGGAFYLSNMAISAFKMTEQPFFFEW